MKSGPFIKIVAQAYGVEESTVTLVARMLKEAGLMTTGARGVNAPEMTALDAARITIALLGTDRPGRAVEIVRTFGEITYDAGWSRGNGDWAIGADDRLLAFEEVLAKHFSFSQPLPPFYSVTLHADAMRAEIQFYGAGKAPDIAVFTQGFDTVDDADAALEAQMARRGIQHSRTLAANDLMKVGIAIMH